MCVFGTEMLPGHDLVNRLEHEKSCETRRDHIFVSSKKAALKHEEAQICWYSFADVYGFRPSLPGLLYLSPWEFVMFWEVYRVPTPKAKSDDGLQVNRTKMERGMCQNVCMNCL